MKYLKNIHTYSIILAITLISLHCTVEAQKPEIAETINVKVALVMQNPVYDGEPLHERYGWFDPDTLTQIVIETFREVSHGVINFEIVKRYDNEVLFTRLDGKLITVDQLVEYYDTDNWQPLKDAHQNQTLKFDYRELIRHYDFCSMKANGEIDEVWVFAHPYAAMYESQLVGKGAFWWNSPPIEDTCEDVLISVMGWNFERDWDLAVHSVGHRVESALRRAFGRWDHEAENLNYWELYTLFDDIKKDKAQVGNIHFPPNGVKDYDYKNETVVLSYADGWANYPNIECKSRKMDCTEWGCTHGGYMKWWFSHLPHFKGVTDGVLNNWWHYVVDYYGAEEIAKELSKTD